MLDVVSVEIDCPEDRHDILIADLALLGYHAFVRERSATLGWIDASLWGSTVEQGTRRACAHVGGRIRSISEIPPQNWNEIWEATVRPIRVPPFLVRPSWAPAEEGLHDIVVDPKMSFGTGHHETTRLMLDYIPEFVSKGSTVLDLGTGTGVLAIAAARLGASRVLAVDNDPWSVENAKENVAANQVNGAVSVSEGTLEDVVEAVDVLLANINTGVLLACIPQFAGNLEDGGVVVLSGMLERDVSTIVESLEANGFSVLRRLGEGEWWSVAARLAGRAR